MKVAAINQLFNPFFFFFFFMGNINSLPQENEVQLERQNKGKRHLAAILPSQEQQPKIDPFKLQKIYFTSTSQLIRRMYYTVGLPFLEHQTTRLGTAPRSQHCTSVCNLLHRPKPIIDPGGTARQSPPLLKQSQQNPMGLFHSCIF